MTPANRRLTVITTADVVDYSRLMEADEAGTLAALKERRTAILEPTVEAHGGRVVKLDGRRDAHRVASAVNAVTGAIELQEKFTAADRALARDRHISAAHTSGTSSVSRWPRREHRRPPRIAGGTGRHSGCRTRFMRR